MVTEKQNARRVVHLGVLAHVALKENGGHGRDVFVAEAQVGAGKAGVARLHAWDAHVPLFVDHVPREDLLAQCHRWGAKATNVARHPEKLKSGLNGREKYFLLHARYVEGKQAAVLDYLPRDLIFSGGEFVKRNLLACANLVNQREVGRG